MKPSATLGPHPQHNQCSSDHLAKSSQRMQQTNASAPCNNYHMTEHTFYTSLFDQEWVMQKLPAVHATPLPTSCCGGEGTG